jgi:hypothetical protein
MVWVPLLACPAVFSMLAVLDKPAVAPASKSVITFDNSYGHPSRSSAVPKDQKKRGPHFRARRTLVGHRSDPRRARVYIT